MTRGYSTLTAREGADAGAGSGAGVGVAWDARFNPASQAPAAAAAGAGAAAAGAGSWADGGGGGGSGGLQTWRRLVRDVPLLDILPKDPRFGLGRVWRKLLTTSFGVVDHRLLILLLLFLLLPLLLSLFIEEMGVQTCVG